MHTISYDPKTPKEQTERLKAMGCYPKIVGGHQFEEGTSISVGTYEELVPFLSDVKHPKTKEGEWNPVHPLKIEETKEKKHGKNPPKPDSERED